VTLETWVGSKRADLGNGHKASFKPAAPEGASSAARKADDYWLWMSELWYYNNQDMTSERCEEIVEMTMRRGTFAAVRVPDINALSAGDGVTLPVAFRDGVSPYLSIIQYSGPPTPVVTMPLVYRPEYHNFVASNLPTGDGDTWLALGVDRDAEIECPADLSIPSADWELYSSVHLDLGGEAWTCDGCVFETWGCMEGLEPPSKAAAKLWAGVAGKSVVEADNITCIGPLPVRLTDPVSPDPPSPTITVSGPGFLESLPPVQARFHHMITNFGSSQVTVDVEVSSSMGLDPELYNGTWEAPDLGSPLIGPLTIDGGYGAADVWVVVDVPAGTAGADVIQITVTAASAPSNPVSNADLLWVGDLTLPEDTGVRIELNRTPVLGIDSPCPRP
jgi:hypothetical protein